MEESSGAIHLGLEDGDVTAEATVQARPSSLPAKEAPRMKGHWFWGCALDLTAERTQFLIDGHEEYGDVFVSRALIRDLMFVRDPAVVNAMSAVRNQPPITVSTPETR